MSENSKTTYSVRSAGEADADASKLERRQAQEKYQVSVLAFLERNQIVISRTMLIMLYLTHFTSKNPEIINITSKFMHLQYGSDVKGTTVYDIGKDDSYVVIHGIVAFTFLRSFLMKYIFAPFSSYMFKMGSKAKTRYAEQSWAFLYPTASFFYGMYLYYHSSYWGNLDNVYMGWPHNKMSFEFKLYYLLQIAFWIQLIFVLNVEERRKDHYQMFSHHIITTLLCVGSYRYYYTRIGNLILVIMDSGDIFLTGAKLLKYAGFSFLCDLMFVCFLLSWVVLRHGVYNYLFYHAWARALDLMADGKCIPGKVQDICWSPTIVNTFYSLLGLLQVICILWFFSILKVAYRVITGSGAADVRSDSEDTDDELEDDNDKDYNEETEAQEKKN